MLLAGMDSEPVAYTDEEELNFVNDMACMWTKGMGINEVPLYRHAPPAPVAVPDEMTPKQASRTYGGEVCGYLDGWNACRAAMLKAGPVTAARVPDGWKLVPVEPTKDMLRAGQSVVGFWLNTVHCYSKMIAAAPAAPEQEV